MRDETGRDGRVRVDERDLERWFQRSLYERERRGPNERRKEDRLGVRRRSRATSDMKEVGLNPPGVDTWVSTDPRKITTHRLCRKIMNYQRG